MTRVFLVAFLLLVLPSSSYADDNQAERLKHYCALIQNENNRIISDTEFQDESSFKDEGNFVDEGALLDQSGAPLPEDSSVEHQPKHATARDMAFALPEKMSIPVTVDMLEFAGVTPIGGAEAKGTFAQIDVLRDGKVMYNGIDISARLESLCAEHE